MAVLLILVVVVILGLGFLAIVDVQRIRRE